MDSFKSDSTRFIVVLRVEAKTRGPYDLSAPINFQNAVAVRGATESLYYVGAHCLAIKKILTNPSMKRQAT